MNKHEPHFACAGCADLQSIPANHLNVYDGDLWCDDCWDGLDKDTETGIEYTDLPAFVPEAEQKIQALTEGLQVIKKHMELSKAGTLSNVWHIADAALAKAEVIGK
ncbi:hypothetical protein GJQ54_05110 [Oceanospirillaceae bacterium ASx5O]|nr:hypothetical protein GJQ54_05110 [Oceanospirillaceae bacterium ASx5O]